MTVIKLIELYFDKHAGKSSHIDKQLKLAEQAVKDADKCLESAEPEFAMANLAIARSIISGLVEIITPFHNTLRNDLIEIFQSADNSICRLRDAHKKAPALSL